MIDQHLEQYVTFQTKHDKSNLIRYVAQVCCEEIGFQFLKKQSGQSRKQKGSSSSLAKKMSNDYIKLDEQEIVNKIGHSFRDAALKLKKGNSGNNSISSIAKKEQQQQKQKQQNEQSTELGYYVDCCSDNDNDNDDETSVITSSTTFSESSSIDSQHSWMYETVIEHVPIQQKRISEPILDNFAEQYLLNLCAQQEGDDDDCSMEPMSIFH